MSFRRTSPVAILVALTALALVPIEVVATHKEGHKRLDQGLNRSEEGAFRKSLKALMKNDNVDMVITMRRYSRGRCSFDKRVYWVYAQRGTICFTRKAVGRGFVPLGRYQSVAPEARQQGVCMRGPEGREARRSPCGAASSLSYLRVVATPG